MVSTSVPVLTSLSGGLDCVSGNLLSPHRLLLVRVFYHSHGDDSRAVMFRETRVVSEEGIERWCFHTAVARHGRKRSMAGGIGW